VTGKGKEGGQWAELLWGLLIGLELSLASYVFGEQSALLLDRYLVPGGRDEADLENMQAMCVSPFGGASSCDGLPPRGNSLSS
jgi:hypothetical protein